MSVSYLILVYTGKESGAGTNADVFITLFGADNRISPRLGLGDNRDNFERGDLDQFYFELEDLGDLKKIRIEHDDSGGRAGWFLDKVVVMRQTPPAAQWTFPCSGWLASDEPPGISRELFP